MRITRRFWLCATLSTLVIFLTAQIILAAPRGPRGGGAARGAAGRPAAGNFSRGATGVSGARDLSGNRNFSAARPGTSQFGARPQAGAQFGARPQAGQTPAASLDRVNQFLGSDRPVTPRAGWTGDLEAGRYRSQNRTDTRQGERADRTEDRTDTRQDTRADRTDDRTDTRQDTRADRTDDRTDTRQDTRADRSDDRTDTRQDAREAYDRPVTHYAADNQPFTASWYHDHPQAWQLNYPHADAWAAATFASATSWLGIAATQPTVYSYNNTTYQTTDTATSDPQQVEGAGDLVNEGDLEPNTDAGEWLPLGVFALVPSDGTRSHQMVQIMLNKDGVLHGSYYDVLSDTGQNLYGSVDKQTQRAAWTAGSGDGVIFETTIASLTDNGGPVYLHFGNGQTQKWQLVRQQAPPHQP